MTEIELVTQRITNPHATTEHMRPPFRNVVVVIDVVVVDVDVVVFVALFVLTLIALSHIFLLLP